MDLLFGEIMGKTIGTCKGIGGSQHLHYRNFYSNGVQGGTLPTTAGMALAEKERGTGAIATVFMGDGTLGEGAVYETFNLAALWALPVLFVIEANGYAQSTPTSKALAGELAARPRAFGIHTEELEFAGPAEVSSTAARLIEMIRRDSRPAALVLKTFRLGPHSKGDDLRPREEIAAARERDPLEQLLRDLPRSVVEATDREVRGSIEQSVERCIAAAELTANEFHHLTRAA
jgi:TPP-dependent pyruvate/acetoin dehydrogenase alpha subunit